MRVSLNCKVLVTFAFLVFIISAAAAMNGRNVCQKCAWIGGPETILCELCHTPFNQCLNCLHSNQVRADYCGECAMPMAEMRVLNSIDPVVRAELKLGESPRARADMDILRLEHLMRVDPDNHEEYLFDLARRHQQIKFYARESKLWLEFLKRFPGSEKTDVVKFYASDSLRKWSYLMYSQGKFSVSVDLLKESLRLNPGNKEARRWLGYAGNALKKGGEVSEEPELLDEPEKIAYQG